MTNYIQRNVQATGVYIGKLEKPVITVQEDDDDNAHVKEEDPLVIKFKHANTDHKELMVGQVLHPNKGICHKLFSEEQAEAEEPEAPVDEDGAPVQEASDSKDILKTFKHVYVPQVIRDKNIHYYNVPKLGSFMAIPFVYRSCLFPEALDAAILDYQEVMVRLNKQNEERHEYEQEQEEIKEEKLKNGEPYEPEPKEWEVIAPAPF